MDDLVAKALHAARQHFDEGGFLDSLRGMFSGPDYLSTGEVASFANMPTQDETNADFFKADKAMRLAQQASEPDREIPQPPRRPVEAPPRQQIASPPPAPAPAPVRQAFTPVRVEDLAVPPAPEPRAVNPYDFGRAVTEHQMGENLPIHLTEQPGFGQNLNLQDMLRADIAPEIGSRRLHNYTLPEAALASPAPQAAINNAVSLARETIPDFNTALANVEKFQNAGIFSGNEYDKAGEILQAHNRARDAGIPVEEALRLNRAAGPMMINQGMPREERAAAQPLAYTAAPTPAPAQAAITAAIPVGAKFENRVADQPNAVDLNRQQADYVARTIAAETSGKSPEEAQAIASVILNRIRSGQYGATPEDVLFAKNQFEPWSNRAGANYPMKISDKSQRYLDAQAALEAAQTGEDITRGATNFWGPKSQYALGRSTPKFARDMPDYSDIGETRFHRPNRAEGGLVDDALRVVREHHADGEAVGQAPETNALGMTPDQFAEYTQTKAPPAPGFVESALRNVREYAMPRGEDYTHAMDQSAAAADYLTKSGKEGMLSGNPWEMAKGAGKSMLGTALPVIAPVGAALEAGVINPAERVLGPAGRHAAEVATMVPGEGATAAMKIARATGEAAPVVTAMSMIPKAAETVAPVRKSLDDIVGGWENKGVKLDVSGGGEKPLGISRIVVPENMRNQGIGSQVMNDLIAHADDANKMMTLTPSKDFGASSVDRLKDFYKQFGFVENKGKNKDYAISDTMYRKPAVVEPQKNAEALNFYPRTFYHATHEDFPAFDINRSGKGSTIGGNEPAAFLTDKPAVADSYLAGNYVDRSAPAVQAYGSADLGEGVGRTYARGSNVMPLRVRDLEQFHDWDMGGGSYSPSHVEAAIQQARKENAPGVIFRNMRDPGLMTSNGPLGSPREPSNILAVLDPAYLRSIWAGFDPAKKESRDLLASIGGVGALGAGAAAMPEDVLHEARGGSVEDRALMLISKQA
jgi:spore germination cell wall hydrolase CwlJ-like protein/GNAT superfamily N-acetyltransferase